MAYINSGLVTQFGQSGRLLTSKSWVQIPPSPLLIDRRFSGIDGLLILYSHHNIVFGMKDIAPQVFRQRLLVECIYSIEIHEKSLEQFLIKLPKALGLKVYSKPSIHVATGRGKKINSGYDAFVPLISSEIYAGVWPEAKFISVVIYSCSEFDAEHAVEFTKQFFAATKVVYKKF